MPETLPPQFPGLMQDAALRFAQVHGAQMPPQPLAAMPELGWPLWLLPQALGGLQGHLQGMAEIVEALARQATVLPVIEACVVAPLLLAADVPRAQAVLAQPVREALAQGEPCLPLLDPCAPWGGPDAGARLSVRARLCDGRWRLQGQVSGVPVFAHDHRPAAWLVPACTDAGHGLLVVLQAEQARALASYRGIDGGWASDWALELEVHPDQVLAEGDAVWRALEQATQAACLMGCVDMAAATAALVERTIEYLQQRRQFDAALSTFQVLRHRVVDMHVRCRASRGLLARFFREAGADPQAIRTLRLMKLAIGENARFCAESAIQCHGAMGISEELLATRLAQRLLHADMRHGDRLSQYQALLDRPADTGGQVSPLAALLHNGSA